MSKRSVSRTRASDMEGDVGGRAEFIGRLVNGMTGIGLAGFRIRARQSGGERTKRVGEARTDAEGRFRLPLSKLEPAPRPWLRLTIADSRGKTVAEEDVPTGVDGVVEVAIAYDGPEPDIAVAAKAARVKVTPALAAWLAERRLETIGDVRRVGGIAGLLGLPVKPDSAVVRMIDGLAALTTLPGDVESKAHLVRHGYTNLVDIARTPERRFTESVGESVDPQAGLEIHRAADVQAGVLLNVVTDVRLGGGTATKQSPIDAAIPQACGCPDCRNALSPLAYLADLLDYAVRHLRENGAPVTITRLGARFRQPFATLPADCESLDTTVHKLRIAIEVLRSYLNYTATPSWYARRVYDTLLTLLGTSTSELRDARQAADDVRARLAARLGVPVQPGKLPVRQSDPLDILFDPIALSALTEATVESLFGYRDTQRPPTDPDPLTGSQLYTWRLTALLDVWMAQDWPAAAPTTTRPQIDPDQVDASDFAATAGPAYLLYTQRLTWIGLRLDAKRAEREQFGLDPMLQDLPVSGLGQAVTVNELLQLKADKAASISIDARLTSLELTHTEFDRLAAIVAAGEANVLAEEWEELYSILVAVEKRRMFPTWRTEEHTPPASLGTVPSDYFPLTLRAGVFRLRPAPLGGDGFEWRPKPWRSDAEARANWVATLRGRIEQEEAVGSSLRAVIARAEEACLPGLRDELVALVPAPSRLTRADWSTRHLQIDVAMGACGRTTRVAQAITTVQGVLFGARNGLLEDGTIELDAPHFDGEWEWIGSYPSWRAAMLLFLYPEAALQPSLRRQSSHGFSQLLTDLQAVDGAVDADASRAAAIRYAGYFDDVCSLAPAGVRISRGRVDPAAPAFFAADVLAIAPADSGQLYLSRFSGQLKDHRAGPPSLVSVDDQSYWRPIDPLPVGTDVAGVVPYRDASGAPRLAVYGRHTVDGVDQLLQTIFDGSDWARPATALDEFPGLVRVAELQGLVPTDPQAGDDVAPWPIRPNDWIVPADIDGDGRRELVVFANASQAGQRAVGVLREREATLVTSSRATIPAGFTPFVPGGPVVLRVTTSTWPWRPERVLLGDPSGPSLALLGTTTAGPLTVLSLPSGPFGAFSLNFGDVLFAGGDLDDDGDDELLIVDYTTVTAPDEGGKAQIVTATRLTVLNVTDAALTMRDQETLPGLIAGTTFPGVPDRWEGFLPMRLESGRRGHLVRTVHQRYTKGNPDDTDEWVGVLKFNSLTNMFSPIELYPRAVSVVGGSFHLWAHGERLQPVELGSDGGTGAGSEILVTDPGTTGTRVLARTGAPTSGAYTSVWSAAASIGRPAGSPARPWTRRGGDRFVPADLDGDGRQAIVVLGNDGRAGVLSWSSAGGLVLGWAADTHVRTPDGAAGTGWRLAATDRIVAVDVDGDGCDELVALSADGRLGLLRGLPQPNSRLLEATDKLRPQDVALRTIEEKRSRTQLAARQALMSDAYAANAATPHNLAYLDEAFYFVPVELGLRCARDGAHTAALDWLATAYDYERPPATRRVAPKLELEQSLSGGLTRAADWLRDPLNPHAIATLRPNAYTRYTISTIVRVLLAYADLEFTREDPESVARALGLYLKVLELLDADELQQRLPGCADLIDRVKIDIGEPELIPWWHDVRALLAEITSVSALAGAVETIERLQSSDGDPGAIVASARSVALKALADNKATFSANADADVAVLREAMSAGLTDDDLTFSLRFDYGGGQHDFVIDEQIPGLFMQPSFMFCVAPNPDLRALRTHAESCLRKIRTCRNIAGWATSLEPYAQPGPSERLSAGDRLPSPARSFVQPLPYRYGVLVERAKQLAQLAGQIQASLLGTLERRDAAAYDVLRSRQDLSLAEAGLRLHDLQVAQATDGLALAQVGRERADLRLVRAKELLAGAQTGGTIGVVVAYVKLVAALAAAGYSAGGGGGSAGGGGGGGQSGSAGGLGEAGSALGGLFSAIGSFYSSIDEQEFQVELATVDTRAAETQLRLAADSLDIATQERAIGGLRLDHAEAVAEFISRKFTGLALYEWMSGVLQGVYRFFLQQAAATARLAEAQLAFERQEIPPPFINGDYWARPSSLASSGGSRGLTGSDRLLRDIYDLDQYAFRTDQRKLALTKTFSLARLDPLAFRRFMETGVMHVATPARLFDRDFPGHFLRLVKRVRVSIIVPPPPDGIHATLATTGVSRVVQGPDFETVLLARGPESIALTSADSATSPFELDSQPDLLVPFENIGVDTSWQLSMPKAANQFDFDAIADVLLTMEYTALDSPIHRERVLASLDRNVTLQRILSFRHELVDAWDDLHDAGASTPGARFRTSRADFAPNLDNVRIDDVTLYFSPASGSVPAGWSMALQTDLAFTPDQGTPFQAAAAATPVSGLITTVPGPGMTALWASLVSPPAPAPFGQWELALPAAATAVLQSGEVGDLVFVIGYSGMLPRWPT